MVTSEVLRAVLEDFYDRVFSDPMIGFYFEGKDKARLVQKELELTGQIVGVSTHTWNDPHESERFLSKVHQPLRIAGGHFDRRLQILKETLQDHRDELSTEVCERWIEHQLRLRPLITGDALGECQHQVIDETTEPA